MSNRLVERTHKEIIRKIERGDQANRKRRKAGKAGIQVTMRLAKALVNGFKWNNRMLTTMQVIGIPGVDNMLWPARLPGWGY